MSRLSSALTGSKTYIIASLGVLYALVHYFLVGDMTSQEAIAWMLGSGGLGALRHGVSTGFMQLALAFGPQVLDALKARTTAAAPPPPPAPMAPPAPLRAVAMLVGIGLSLGVLLSACTSTGGVTIDPSKIDQAKTVWFLAAAGCALNATGSATEAGFGSSLDGTGNLVLTGVNTATGALCKVSVPPAAVAPAPASQTMLERFRRWWLRA